jgi:hypothetical protein
MFTHLILQGRKMLRLRIGTFVLACIGFGLTAAHADTLQLVSASPASIVQINDTQIVPSVTNEVGYAGVLNWVDQSTLPNTDYATFCIDINHSVSTGTSYPSYSVSGAPVSTTANGGDSLLNANLVGAIYYLWNNYLPTTLTNQTAAQFQIALWDVIYDYNTSTAQGTVGAINNNLTVSTPSNGYSQYGRLVTSGPTGDIGIAAGWATSAWQHYNSNIGTADLYTLIAPTSGGQNQLYYLGGPTLNHNSTPLPKSTPAGLALFGLLGAVCFGRKTSVSHKPAIG